MSSKMLLLILLMTAGTTASEWPTQFLMNQETREAVEEIVNQVFKSKGITVTKDGVSHDELASVVNQQGLEISSLRTEIMTLQGKNQELELKLQAVQQENSDVKRVTKEQGKQIAEIKKILDVQDRYISSMKNEMVSLEKVVIGQKMKVKKIDKKMAKGVVSELTHSKYQNTVGINSTTKHITKNLYLKQMGLPLLSVGSKNFDHNENRNILPKATGSHLKGAQTRAAAERGIAFSAYASHFQPHLTAGHVLKCDQTIINDGGGFHGHTGIFTVPESGVYLLSFTFATDANGKWLWIKLVVDDRLIVRAATDAQYSTHVEMGGNTAILSLVQGESVWLEVEKSNDVQIWPVSYTSTFSGVLLY